MNDLSNEKLNNEEMENEVEQGNDYEFLYFPKKGVVVCKLYNCEFTATDRIYKYMNKAIKFEYDNIKKYIIDDVFVGVAKCSPEDTYDKAFGRKLALTKAKAKRGRATNLAIRKFIKDFTTMLSTLTAYGVHEVPNIEKFLNGEE